MLAQSASGKRREAYIGKWPQTKQNEAMNDQLVAISNALRAHGVVLEDAPKFTAMLADFDAIRDAV